MFEIPPEFSLSYDSTAHRLTLDHPLLRRLQIHPLQLNITDMLDVPIRVAEPIVKALSQQLEEQKQTTDTTDTPPVPAYAVFCQIYGGQTMQMLTSWRTNTEYHDIFHDNVTRDAYISDILDAATLANPRLGEILILDTTVMIRRFSDNTYTDHNAQLVSPELLPITASQSTSDNTRTRTLEAYIALPNAMTLFDRAYRALYTRSPVL